MGIVDSEGDVASGDRERSPTWECGCELPVELYAVFEGVEEDEGRAPNSWSAGSTKGSIWYDGSRDNLHYDVSKTMQAEDTV